MKQLFTLFVLCFIQKTCSAQDLYLVQLQPKENTATYFANPLQMLSQRALERRLNRNVSLDSKDVPINPLFIQQIKNLDLGYIGASKWLNTVMVEIDDTETINQLQNLSCVSSIQNLANNTSAKVKGNKINKFSEENTNNYSSDFITMLNLQQLHQAGYKGQNTLIGVIDSGFPGVNRIEAFRKLREENRILDQYNFVNNNTIYEMHSHGTAVLSAMTGFISNQYTGTAPEASYALYVSEDAEEESPKELMYWVQAAERADSIGVDVINTSLGYTTFDDARYDFTYAEMDGNTTLISKGAKIAASRGIFLVNAMGNDGNNSWHYLGAPADVESVFSIGANNRERNPAAFSSFGPNSAAVQKPNVSALGVSVSAFSPNGQIITSSGTSLASPIIAGAVASLMTVFPNKPISELKQMIQESANLFPNYSVQLGFGVPNFGALLNLLNTSEKELDHFQIIPNPAKDWIKIETNKELESIELYNLIGMKLKSINTASKVDVKDLKAGVYLVKANFKDNTIQTIKLIIK